MGSWQEKVTKRDERLSHIFKTGDFSDVTFVVGKLPEQKTFKLHKIILSMYSDVFERMFYGSLPEKSEVQIPDIHPDTFEKAMKYVYEESFLAASMEEAMLVYNTADKYNLIQLRNLCGMYITGNLRPQNIPSLYNMPHLLETLQINKKCEEMLRDRTSDVFSSNNFIESPLEMIVLLLQMDGLNIESEEKLFDFVLKWAKERKKCEMEQAELREIIAPCLPHIRFLAMTVEGFLCGPGSSGVLTDSEIASISANIVSSHHRELPAWCNKQICRKVEAPCPLSYKSVKLLENHSCSKFTRIIADSVECTVRVTGRNIAFQGVSLYSMISSPVVTLTVSQLHGRNQVSLSDTKLLYDYSTGLLEIVLLEPVVLREGIFYRISVISKNRSFLVCDVNPSEEYTRHLQEFNLEYRRHAFNPNLDLIRDNTYFMSKMIRKLPSSHFYEILIVY